MSAPFRLTPGDVSQLATALREWSETTRKTGVRFDAYACADVSVAANATIRVRWDDGSNEYVVDDVVGS